MKRKLWLTALITLMVTVLLFTGCPTAKSTSDTTTPIQQLKDLVTAQGASIADMQRDIEDLTEELEEVGGVDQSDIDALTESIGELTSALNTAVADIGTLKAAVDKLKVGGGNNPIPSTGQVTIEIKAGQDMISASTVWLLSVSNGTTEFKKVYVSAMLTSQGSAVSNVTAASFSGSSPMSTTAFNTSVYFPNAGSCTMIQSISTGYLLMAPGANGVPITISLNLGCAPVVFWNVAFSPIVTSY